MEANAYDPLEIFPLEIWEVILEKLRKQGCSSDVLNCSKVCSEFQRILEPIKQEWLFGLICPFIFPYLKGRELLACRRICKNWCRDVDKFLEDFETWRPFDEGTSDISRSIKYDPLKQKNIKWTKLRNERRLVEFLDGMKKGEMKTPFVGRSVFLGGWRGFECSGGAGGELFERALELLSSYGDEIWHLRVELRDDFRSCSNSHSIQILKQILSCTPNLKSLFLEFAEYLDAHEDDKVKLKNLQLDDHPPPEIISLETLEIKSISTPIVILEKLISSFNLRNLKCLKLHDYYYNNIRPLVVVTPLQHLTELHVSVIKWDDLEHIFNNIISPTAPLAKISVRSPGVSVDRLCNIINRWKGSLKMLAIDGYELGKLVSELDAPNLRSLELEGENLGTYFLPRALTVCLEYLHIRHVESHGWTDPYRPTVDPGKECYTFVFQECELHNSSIWSEMKKLKVIRVITRCCDEDCEIKENVVCSREMHECGIRAETVSIESH